MALALGTMLESTFVAVVFAQAPVARSITDRNAYFSMRIVVLHSVAVSY
jgi:hypothetical protein